MCYTYASDRMSGFFFSSRRRHTRCAIVTGVQTCALPILRQQNLVPYRQRVISAAEGRILEVGVGSGLNLPFYSDKAGHVVALDPSSRLLDRAQKERGCARCPVDLLDGSADAKLGRAHV